MSPVSPVNPASASAPGTRAPWRAVIVDDQALLVSAFEMLLSSQPDLEVVGTAADGAAALELLGSRAQQLQGATPVDVVLMDIRMPVMDGVTAIRAMRTGGGDWNDGVSRDGGDSKAREALRRTPVLVLTTFDEEELVLAALRAGANGFLLKDASAQVLLEAVRTVARGGSWLDPAVTGTVLAHLGAGEGGEGSEGTVATAPGSGPGMGPKPNAPGPASTMDATRPTGAEIGANGLFEPLTGRERDVLSLVCDGLPNAEIGERLHLAESTVKTHVKALLAKTGCRNRVELIVHAFRHGLVAVR